MNSDLADATEVKAAEESAWEILTGFSLPKYAVDSLTHYKNNPESFKNEVLSGITVAVMQVPESVAFSFVAGVPPLVGLYSTFFLGFITAVIGGKEGMISGAAGAMAVVIKDLMADSGPLSSYSKGDRFNHLLMTVLVCGILQTLCGLFQLAKRVKLISKPCMVGFMNGLGIVIFYAQFGAFKKCPYAKATAPESPMALQSRPRVVSRLSAAPAACASAAASTRAPPSVTSAEGTARGQASEVRSRSAATREKN